MNRLSNRSETIRRNREHYKANRTRVHSWVVIICSMLMPSYAIGNPIQDENAKPGTSAWQLSDPAPNHEIEGYASLTSVNRGGTIRLFVNTSDPSVSPVHHATFSPSAVA